MAKELPKTDNKDVERRLATLESNHHSLEETVEQLKTELGRVSVKIEETKLFTKNIFKTAILVGHAIGLLFYVNSLDPPETRLWNELYNAGHVPLFGAVALVLLVVSKMWLREKVRPSTHYVLAFAGAALLGIAHETVQLFGQRDADLLDIARDLVGGAGVLLIVLSFDKTVHGGAWSKTRRWLTRSFGAIVLLVGFAPAALQAPPYIERNSIFPQIVSFDDEWERQFVLTNEGARFRFTSPPPEWTGSNLGTVAQVEFASGQYPSFEIIDVVPDWRNYEAFVLTVFSPNDDVIDLELRIHDQRHNDDYYDRFNTTVQLAPGANNVTISLRDVFRAPTGRHMAMDSIETIMFFVVEPSEPIVLFFDDVRLE